MKIQLKRSNVANNGVAKQPDVGQMTFGELAVNYSTEDPAIFLKDQAENIIRIAGAGNINAGDNPSGPQLPDINDPNNTVGDVFFNTTNNKLYFWDGTAWVPIATDVTAADIFVGTLEEINLEVPVETRRNGFLWWNTVDGSLYIWYIDPDNTKQFVIAIPASGSGGASVAVLDTPPTGPNAGDLWWNTVDGRLYIWYQETIDNGQWVDSSPDSQTSPITSGETFPAEALENDCFFNTTDGRLYIYYYDGSTLQWVDASPDSQGAVYWNRNEDTLVPTSDTNDVNIGGGNIELNANGSATFAGDVEINKGSGASGATNVFKVYGANGTTETASIEAQGSATFAGNVTAGDYPNPTAYISASSIYANANPKSATNSNSGVAVYQDGANNGAVILRNTAGDANVILSGSNGTATFAGNLDYPSGISTSGTFSVGNVGSEGGAYPGTNYSRYGPAIYQNTEYQGTDTSATRNFIICRSSASASAARTMKFQVNGSGKIRSAVTTISAITSERRLKTNIEAIDAEASWQTIKNLPFYSYNWKETPDCLEKNYGPMADEVPSEMVIDTGRSDEQGVIRTFDNDMLQGRLFVALQTALTRIEALEAEVQSLKEGN